MTAIAARRLIGALLTGFLVAGCLAPASTPTGTASGATASAPPSATGAASEAPVETTEPSVEPSEPPPTEEPPVTPIPIDPSCPNATDDTISVQEYVDASTSCFRNGVRVRGWLDTPPALGFEPPLVKPSWIYYPSGDFATSLWHQPPPEPDHVCASGETCWWFFPHPDPDLDLDLEPLHRWVILTGHTRDPRAKNCHYDGEGPNPNPDLVTICGRQFVVTAIEAAP